MTLVVALAVIVAIWWQGQRRAAARPGLTRAEACALLDVSARATRAEVLAAHRRLIARVHPDAGGSRGLAARVNAARDVLIAERR